VNVLESSNAKDVIPTKLEEYIALKTRERPSLNSQLSMDESGKLRISYLFRNLVKLQTNRGHCTL